ncbi:hypothetical protein [Tenacibaculum sp. Ill]|uniref:hypothetical protein n=1 Tax=Tenacibaculum sp. Ill TaxID=3445935 RepID=UPI003F7A15AE
MENLYYDLIPSSSQWKVGFIIDYKNEKLKTFFQSLSERRIAEIDEPLSMITYNIIEEENKREDKSPFVYDALYWSNDIRIGSSTLHGITSFIMSDRLKKIIENFELPEHRFYDVDITNIYSKESRRWYLLYMPENSLDYFDWIRCEFKLKPEFRLRNQIDTSYIGPNVVNSRDEFIKLRSKYRKNKIKKFLEFYKIKFKVKFDIMWGNVNILTVSDKLRKEILSKDINITMEPNSEIR